MEEAMLTLAAICFLLIGLSHVFQPQTWVKFFILIREQEEVGAFINGFVHFPLGALIVAFHNVWAGIPMVLTLIGYGLLLKSVICFLFPRLALRSLNRVSLDRSWEFIAAGIFSLGLSALFFYSRVYR
jgi:hypothetical protein